MHVKTKFVGVAVSTLINGRSNLAEEIQFLEFLLYSIFGIFVNPIMP